MNWDLIQGDWMQFKDKVRKNWAKLTDEPWQSGNYPIAKLEATFDYVVCGLGARVRTYDHLRHH